MKAKTSIYVEQGQVGAVSGALQGWNLQASDLFEGDDGRRCGFRVLLAGLLDEGAPEQAGRIRPRGAQALRQTSS
jgi:hypothetical protein